MYRVITALLLAALVLAALPATPSQAQDDLTAVTFSESQINAAIQEGDERFVRLSNLVVDLKPGTIVMTGGFAGSRDNSFAASLTILPQYVSDNFVGWAVEEFALTGTAVSGEGVEEVFTNIFLGTWRAYERSQFSTGGDIISVTLTETSITYYVDPTGEQAIGGAWDLANNTFTITEAELNAATNDLGDAVNSDVANAVITDEYIDLQPGQVVFTAFATPPTTAVVSQYVVTAIFTPTVTLDGVSWELTSFAGFNAPSRTNFSSTETYMTDQWVYRTEPFLNEDYQVTDITITDTEMIYTVVPR